MYVTVLHSGDRREVKSVHIIITFFISLEANIAAFYICKWLERNKWQ